MIKMPEDTSQIVWVILNAVKNMQLGGGQTGIISERLKIEARSSYRGQAAIWRINVA